MLGIRDDVRLVLEAKTSKDPLECLRAEFTAFLHCVASGLSPVQTSRQLSKSLCVYLRSIFLVRGCGFSFD